VPAPRVLGQTHSLWLTICVAFPIPPIIFALLAKNVGYGRISTSYLDDVPRLIVAFALAVLATMGRAQALRVPRHVVRDLTFPL